jgi:hypothetical protein
MTPVKPHDEQIHYKTWLNWGHRFEIFPIEKNNKESQYQKSFSAFFTSVSHTKSHWYSLKVLNDVIPSLSNLMGISQENLKKLFPLSGFSKSNKSRNFIKNKNCLSPSRMSLASKSIVNLYKPNIQASVADSGLFEFAVYSLGGWFWLGNLVPVPSNHRFTSQLETKCLTNR